jgi:hypothetical protein
MDLTPKSFSDMYMSLQLTGSAVGQSPSSRSEQSRSLAGCGRIATLESRVTATSPGYPPDPGRQSWGTDAYNLLPIPETAHLSPRGFSVGEGV